MNVTIMLERGEEKVNREPTTSQEICKRQTTATGERDNTRNTRRSRPTTLHNEYNVLVTDVETDDIDKDNGNDDEDARDQTNNAETNKTKHKLNKRQRSRRNRFDDNDNKWQSFPYGRRRRRHRQ